MSNNTTILSACCKAEIHHLCLTSNPPQFKHVCSMCGINCENNYEQKIYSQQELDESIKKAVEEQVQNDIEICEFVRGYGGSTRDIQGKISSQLNNQSDET